MEEWYGWALSALITPDLGIEMSIYHRPVNYNNDSLLFGFPFLFFRVLLTRPCCPTPYHTVQAILCPAFLAWSYRPSEVLTSHMCLSVWTWACMLWQVCGGQRAACGTWFSLSTIWVLGPKWTWKACQRVFFPNKLIVTPTSVLQCLWLNPGPHDTRHVFCHWTTSPALYHIFIFF